VPASKVPSCYVVKVTGRVRPAQVTGLIVILSHVAVKVLN